MTTGNKAAAYRENAILSTATKDAGAIGDILQAVLRASR